MSSILFGGPEFWFGENLEAKFNKILDRTLLATCALLLTGAVIIAASAGVKFVVASNPSVDRGYISVPYEPLLTLVSQGPVSASSEELTDNLSANDLKLMSVATPGCQAIGRFASAISGGRLYIFGTGLSVCEKAQLKRAKKFGERAANYLTEFSSYFSQLSSDPHAVDRYRNVKDSQVRNVVVGLVTDFASKFQRKIDAQYSNNRSVEAEASVQRASAVTYLGVAGAAFVAFLSLAFLIIFMRIEKYLEKISGKSEQDTH